MLLCLSTNGCVIITNSGIGKETARRLAIAGAKVAVVDYDLRAAEDTAFEINTERGTTATFPIQADISNHSQIKAAVKKAQQELPGSFSIAVNCAGITGRSL